MSEEQRQQGEPDLPIFDPHDPRCTFCRASQTERYLGFGMVELPNGVVQQVHFCGPCGTRLTCALLALVKARKAEYRGFWKRWFPGVVEMIDAEEKAAKAQAQDAADPAAVEITPKKRGRPKKS
jgi:hypothetical protein